FSVAVLCNLASTNPSALSRKIADIYLASALGAVVPPATAQSPQPGREQLEKWAGLYVEPQEGDRVMRVGYSVGERQGVLEADVPREVVVRDGKLVVLSLKSGEIALLPVAADLFNGRGNRIRFLRDAQGKVTGASLSTFRIWNFRFARSP